MTSLLHGVIFTKKIGVINNKTWKTWPHDFMSETNNYIRTIFLVKYIRTISYNNQPKTVGTWLRFVKIYD